MEAEGKRKKGVSQNQGAGIGSTDSEKGVGSDTRAGGIAKN